jgi:hypothetical protein
VRVRRYWWWIRLGLFIVLFIGLGIYLLSATPWRRWIGLAPDYSPLIARGNEIVNAVHAFRATHGLWPQYLEDLVPDYLPPTVLDPLPKSQGGGRWFYDLTPVPDDTAPSGLRTLPSLSVTLPESKRAHLGYDFDPQDPAWHLFGDVETDSRTPYRPPPSPAATRPAAELLAAALTEMDRRIEREPGDVEHRRRKAGLLMTAGRLNDVRAAVARAAQDFPDSYWPRLATAVLDLAEPPPPPPSPAPHPPATAPDAPAPIRTFAEWVEKRPSFTHWFYLSHLERLANRPDAAAAAMSHAAKLPAEIAADDPNTSAYYLWDMARWTLESKRWPLVVEITDAWQLAHADKTVADASFLPLRAAARLASGNVTAAQADLAAFDDLPAPRRAWAKNVDDLRAAAARGDVGYRYVPGKLPGAFEVFPAAE